MMAVHGDLLFEIVDFAGIFVFALSGGALAVERRFDLFGVLFLAFVAAVSGGIVRDLVIGATPPAAFATWHILAVTTAAGLACYVARPLIDRLAAPVLVFDAIGLGLFAVAGAQKALDAGLSPMMAAVLGMITAIGGGIMRDILTTRTPMVFRADIYALAALAGASLVTFGTRAGLPAELVGPAGAALAITIRLMAMHYRWSLPPSGR